MRSRNHLLLLLAGLCVSVSAAAAGPTATAVFQVRDPVTHHLTTVAEARLDQHVCLSILAELIPVGRHSVRLTIYDGLGDEVYRTVTRKVGSDTSLDWLVCHGFDEDEDPAGTWWYVVDLDDEPLVSTSIEIRPRRN